MQNDANTPWSGSSNRWDRTNPAGNCFAVERAELEMRSVAYAEGDARARLLIALAERGMSKLALSSR